MYIHIYSCPRSIISTISIISEMGQAARPARAARPQIPAWPTWSSAEARQQKLVAPVPPAPHPRTSFLLGGGWEGIGNALIFHGSCESASPTVRRDFRVVLNQKHPRGAQGTLRRRLGNSLKSSDLQASTKGSNEREVEPQLC